VVQTLGQVDFIEVLAGLEFDEGLSFHQQIGHAIGTADDSVT
jgi:hypothetical protein